MSENDIELIRQTTRDSIKEKFLEMYKDRPLKKITVSDLISTCKISRGTFYFYFTDIYALYRECEQDMIDFMEGELRDVNLSTVRRDYNKHIEVYNIFLKKYAEHNGIIKCFLTGSEKASFRQAWFDSFHRNFAKSMEFSDDMSPSKRNNLILFFVGGQLEVLSNWILSGCKEPIEDISCIQAQVLFLGIFFESTVKKTR